MRGPALQALCRELGDKHMVQALQHVHEAQKHMRLAEERLMFVEGIRQNERRAAELRERIELFAFGLDARLEQLRATGGPKVDADELRAEVERRQAETDTQMHERFLAGWRELCEHHQVNACTAREAVTWLHDELESRARTPEHHTRFDRLLVALEYFSPASLGRLPDVRQVSLLCSGLAGRVVAAEWLHIDNRAGRRLWGVRRGAAAQARTEAEAAAAPRACAGGR